MTDRVLSFRSKWAAQLYASVVQYLDTDKKRKTENCTDALKLLNCYSLHHRPFVLKRCGVNKITFSINQSHDVSIAYKTSGSPTIKKKSTILMLNPKLIRLL